MFGKYEFYLVILKEINVLEKDGNVWWYDACFEIVNGIMFGIFFIEEVF